MPRSKTLPNSFRPRDTARLTRYEEQEETFLTPEERQRSGIITNPGLPTQTVTGPGTAPGRKGKRSVEDMMANMPNDHQQSLYALERIASAEDLIAKVLGLCSPKALEYVLEQRPSLKKYAPDND